MKTVGGILAALGLVAVVNAQYYQNVSSSSIVSYETVTTDVLTTYCPGPTVITQGGKKYTVTEATTLTITDCPCTVTKPVHTVYGPTTTPYAATETSTGPAGGYGGYTPSQPSSSNGDYWTTTVVTDYVTYCPYATTFSHGDKTYVVTEATTVTVTNCGGSYGSGCTISYTVPPAVTQPPVTQYITNTYTTSKIPTTVVTYSVIVYTVTPYAPVVPPTYPPQTVYVTVTPSSSGSPPVVTQSVYLPSPPILCFGCYTIPVYLAPSPSGQPPVPYTTPIPVYTQIVTVTASSSSAVPTGPVACAPAYGFPPIYGPPGCIPPWIVTAGPPPPVSTGPPVPCLPTTEFPPIYGPAGCIPPWLYTLPPPIATIPTVSAPVYPGTSTVIASSSASTPVSQPPALTYVILPPKSLTPAPTTTPAVYVPSTSPAVYKPSSTVVVYYTGAADRVNSGFGALVLGGLAALFI